MSATPVVRPLTDDDRPRARSFLIEQWGSDSMAVAGELFRPHEHDGFVATLDGAPAGLLTYRSSDDASVEVTSLTAWPQWRGVGTALLAAAAEAASASGARRLWLVTTNDNVDALRFYQRRGMRLAALRAGAVDEARRLKPGIPAIGQNGIALRDELVLEMALTDEREQ